MPASDTTTAADYLAAHDMPAESLNAFRVYLFQHPEYKKHDSSTPRRSRYALAVISRAFDAWRATSKKDAAQYRGTTPAPRQPARRKPRRVSLRSKLEALHALTLRALLHHAALGSDADYPAILAHDLGEISLTYSAISELNRH